MVKYRKKGMMECFNKAHRISYYLEEKEIIGLADGAKFRKELRNIKRKIKSK